MIQDTGLKVLEILKLISEKEVSYLEAAKEIVELTPETFLRYINTIKYAGFNVSKSAKSGKYKLERKPFAVDLTDSELETFGFLEDYVESLNSHHTKKEFDEFSEELFQYLTEDCKTKYKKQRAGRRCDIKYSYKHLEAEINIFESFCRDKLKLEIVDKDEKTYVVEPKEIIYDKNCVYLSCYIPKEAGNKRILIEDIVSYKQLPTKSGGSNFLNTAVFECSGRLAKNYKLKPSEKIINSSSDCVIISNANDDRDILMKRILKYGENAKILQPKSFREEMVKILDEMIENCERTRDDKNSDNSY